MRAHISPSLSRSLPARPSAKNRPTAVPEADTISRPESLEKLRAQFRQRYGGEQLSKVMLERAVKRYGHLDHTAERILQAAARNKPFVMGFAGYSVTVGRGNFFNQSFPFVVEQILKGPMEELVPSFYVRNAAIGGIPSFPYAFCIEHFLGVEPDVFSWDFSMNEGKSSSVLEAYIRHGLHQLNKKPMLIMLDTNKARCDLLTQYTSHGILKDAISVSRADKVVDRELLAQPEHERPLGLQDWDSFGAPARCPGKGSWHPKKMEHELMGWMIAMYFVDALERAHELISNNPTWRTDYMIYESPAMTFPAPLHPPPSGNDPVVNNILYGSQHGNDYVMKKMSCRTNFLPASDEEKVLPSIIESGLSRNPTVKNILDVRSDSDYQDGWVLDVSQVERDTKIKVEKCGGLGYIDMKIALYGVPESGPLHLWLPFEGKEVGEDEFATNWFTGLIVCEANEKRGEDACKLHQDIEYKVGGVLASGVSVVSGAAEYLKRQTCVNVPIPAGATVSWKGSDVGLLLEVTAKSNVSRKAGACCVSHVVWEQNN